MPVLAHLRHQLSTFLTAPLGHHDPYAFGLGRLGQRSHLRARDCDGVKRIMGKLQQGGMIHSARACRGVERIHHRCTLAVPSDPRDTTIPFQDHRHGDLPTSHLRNMTAPARDVAPRDPDQRERPYTRPLPAGRRADSPRHRVPRARRDPGQTRRPFPGPPRRCA